jgi:hypothetical protein
MTEAKDHLLKPKPNGIFAETLAEVSMRAIPKHEHTYVSIKLSNGQGFVVLHNRNQITRLVKQCIVRSEKIPELKNGEDLQNWLQYLITNQTPFAFTRSTRHSREEDELIEDIKFN